MLCHQPDIFSNTKTMAQERNEDDIRQKFQIAFINELKSSALPEVNEAETGFPDMGLVIGLYMMGDAINPIYRDKADKLLESILSNDLSSFALSIKNGLLGIGCGLIYLLRNNFAEGDEDEILESLDMKVSSSILYYTKDVDFDRAGTFCYLRKRALMPCRKNLIIQLRIQKTILHLLDLYKLHFKHLYDAKIEKELDDYCDINLFKSLITIYRRAEHEQMMIEREEHIIDSDSVTFVIPLRIDSEERRSNLFVILEQLLSIAHSEIIILEADKKSALEDHTFCNRIQHHFIKDIDPVYHRTKYINKLLQMAQSPIVGIWDTDVIVTKEQIAESVRHIREGDAVMSFPFDGRFYDISPALSHEFRKERSLQLFQKHKDTLRMSFGTYSVGGAFLVNKAIYCRLGGENEHFYGWGAEDNERVKRVELLGYRIHRANGAMYHLYHPRNNSQYAGLACEINNMKELIKVSNMSPEGLKSYVTNVLANPIFRG